MRQTTNCHDLRDENFRKALRLGAPQAASELVPIPELQDVVVMPTTNEATPISRFARGLAGKDNCLAVLLQRIKTRAPI
jgi:hypothetical protein